MIYYIGKHGIGETIELTDLQSPVSSQYKWHVYIYSSDSGYKKDWYLGQENCPINKIQFEINEKGCANAVIGFSEVDFIINSNDEINVLYDGFLLYVGIIENVIDPKGGTLPCKPWRNRLENHLLYDGSFSSKTDSEILQTIIQSVQDDSKVYWNAGLVDTGSTTTYSPDYEYKKIGSIIQDRVDGLDDRKWGVFVSKALEIYQPSTSLTKWLLYSGMPDYTQISVKKNYSTIKVTRYQVFKKTGTGAVSRAGQVGYDAAGGDYPILTEFENNVGIKEDKYTVDTENVSDTEAKDLAYAALQAQTVGLTIDVKNLDIDVYRPAIGDLVRIEDKEEKVIKQIISCDTLTQSEDEYYQAGSWSDTGHGTIALDETNFKEGTGSVKFIGSALNHGIIYTFDDIQRFSGLEKICFMIRSDNALLDGELIWSVGESAGGAPTSSGDLFHVEIPIIISSLDTWQYYEASLTDNFKYFGLRFTTAPSSATTVNIDQISIYADSKIVYEGNVKQINYVVDQNGYSCHIKLSEYDLMANDVFFDMDKKLNKLETIVYDGS
jgi:hypothetical protein